MLKTPLRYLGKKEQEIHLILPYIENADMYVEPFVGSCSVLLSLLQTRPRSSFKRYIASDIDRNLIEFWKYVQLHGDDIKVLLKKFLREYSIDFVPTNDIESMLSHIVSIQCRNFHRLNTIDEDLLNRFRSDAFKGYSFDDLALLIEGVEFKCKDYKEILKESKSRGTVSTFCDPPYMNVTSGIRSWYSSNLVSIMELKEILEGCKSFVLSYSNDTISEQLLEGMKHNNVVIKRGFFTRQERYYYNK